MNYFMLRKGGDMDLAGKKIFFSVGDPSGDINTAPLIKLLTAQFPTAEVKGLGGPAMEKEGFAPLFEFSRFNKMGYWEVIKELPFLLKEKKRFYSLLHEERPDLLVCVDYSGFNRPLMKEARSLGIPVLWFIAPMIWVWKRYKHGPYLGKYVSHIATIFPFEPKEWEEFTPHASFVGNPIFENSKVINKKERTPLSGKDSIKIALVPGSRVMEVKYSLPTMVEAAKEIQLLFPHKKIEVLVSQTTYINDTLYEPAQVEGVTLFNGSLEELYSSTDVALVFSGTATFQAALQWIPHCVCYNASYLTFIVMRHYMKGNDYISLPNFIYGDKIVPEAIQKGMTTEVLVDFLKRCMTDDTYYLDMVDKLKTVENSFGGKKPSEELLARIGTMIGESCAE